MLINESFDADDILRDADDQIVDNAETPEDMEELEFGSQRTSKSHYDELAGEMDNADDLWE